MKIDTPASVQIHSGNETLDGTCKDLSGGGLLIELNTTLPIGEEVEVTISSSHGHSPMLHAIAEVMRVDAQLDTTERPCSIGMRITRVLN